MRVCSASAGPALIINTNEQMKSNLDSKIAETGSKYTSQGRKRHSSKPPYKPQPTVQMEFAFELAGLDRQQNTQSSSMRKTPRK